MIRDLGIVEPGTTLYIPFHTFDSNDPSASVTLTGLATTDIEIYKDGNTTQRASDSGYALLDTDGIDFDGITGIHGISINLADNTTANFYAAGSQYWVVISSVTVDAATINFVLATFRIGYPGARLNTTIATLASQTSFTLTNGPAEDNALNGFWCIIHDVASAVQQGHAVISAYTGSTKTVTLAAGTTFTAAAGDNISVMGPAPLQPATTGRTLIVEADGMAYADAREWLGGTIATPTVTGVPEVDITHIAGSANSTSTAQLGVNVVNAGGTAWGSGAITAASIATGAIDADALAADAGTELGTAVWATATRTLTANTNLNDPTAATIADAVWDEARSGHVGAGSFGEGVASVQGNVTGSVASVTGAVTLANGAHGGAAATITLQTPVQVDIRKVNNITVDGAGTSGDPWGPV